MKFTLLTPALAAVLGLALAGAPVTVQAQTTTPVTTSATTTPAKPTTAKPKKTEYSGSLTAIDTAGGSVTVESTSKKSGAKTLVLLVTATTKIKRDGKAATLAEFKVGDKVTGSYTADAAGKLTAASLYFGSSKKKEKTTAPKTTAPATTTSAPAATTPAPVTTPAAQ